MGLYHVPITCNGTLPKCSKLASAFSSLYLFTQSDTNEFLNLFILKDSTFETLIESSHFMNIFNCFRMTIAKNKLVKLRPNLLNTSFSIRYVKNDLDMSYITSRIMGMYNY